MENKPTIPEVLPQIREYYAKPGNSVGGSLHVVLEDGNVDDFSVMACAVIAIRDDDLDGHALAETLSRMSQTQRKKLSLMNKGGE